MECLLVSLFVCRFQVIMLTEFIHSIVSAASISDANACFIKASNHYGYRLVQYRASFATDIPLPSLREAPLLLGNLPRSLNMELTAQDLIDRTIRTTGVISAAAISQELGNPAMFERLIGEGLGLVQAISLYGTVLNSCGVVLLWAGRHASEGHLTELWHQSGHAMELLANVLHMRIATLSRGTAGRDLTPRQREVLLWRSLGKTVAEIAVILGITVATVEKHLRLARENLGVETTPQAVLKAHVTQQLFAHGDSIAKQPLPQGNGKDFRQLG